MRIAIVDTYYQSALAEIYKKHADLGSKNFALQKEVILNFSFGTSDAYSFYLNKLGCSVIDIIANCEPLQRQWYREHVKINSLMGAIKNSYKWLMKPSLPEIALLQIKEFKPDIVYCQDLSFLTLEVLSFIKRQKILLVGQIACPLPSQQLLYQFDLILSSFPHYVDYFKKQGIHSEFLPIGFDTRVLDKLDKKLSKVKASFIGGISKAHGSAKDVLEYLAVNTPMEFYGYVEPGVLDKSSPILNVHHGEKWGMDMYSQLAASDLTLNRHIDVSANYANNMRLFEATGVGALLITDCKDNLGDYFDIGKEVIAYRTKEEARELIDYYLDKPEELRVIADAGQKKCLSHHSYQNRMESLKEILMKHA